MKLTIDEITPVQNCGKLVAFVTIHLDSIRITGLKIIEVNNDEFCVVYPSRKGRDGKYHQIVFITNPITKEAIEERILSKWLEIRNAQKATKFNPTANIKEKDGTSC